MYDNAKKDFKNGTNKYFSDFLIGWIGFMASFNSVFFTGFSGKTQTKEGIRDYTDEAIRNIENQISKLDNVKFIFSNYADLIIPDNSIIYCDIPYRNTTKYETDAFNHDFFYDWAELKSKQGHKIFISEYWMPEDRFTKIWQKQIKSNLSTQMQKKIECLFIPKKQEVNQYATLF